MINQKIYIPEDIRILSTKRESATVQSYELDVQADFLPGQFLQVSMLGISEAPISISSSPTGKKSLEITVRCVGKLTRAMCRLARGDSLGLRGPYGNSFPLNDIVNRDLVFVAGGIGLAPLRSAVRYAMDNRKRYGRLTLLYGARTSQDMIFKDDLEKWEREDNVDVHLTIDHPEKTWKNEVGVVTTLFDKVKLDVKNCSALVCGPPIMIKYTIQKLVEVGLNDGDIFVTLERYMKCGVGKCGHCYIGNKYVCTDGPVFSLKQLKEIKPEEVIA